MSMLLLRENGTVTVCHSRTKNLKEVCRRADILVVAIGKPEMIDASYIKEGATVIDVGSFNFTEGLFISGTGIFILYSITTFISSVPGIQ